MLSSAIGFHSYASRIGSKELERMNTELEEMKVSIHTLHELEASEQILGTATDLFKTFPFIRFTNWKQEYLRQLVWRRKKVSIHTLHELEARCWPLPSLGATSALSFHSYASRIGSKNLGLRPQKPKKQAFPFIRFTNWKQEATMMALRGMMNGFHSYASRIGSKKRVSGSWKRLVLRFHSYASRIGSKTMAGPNTPDLVRVSIHTLHELEASSTKSTDTVSFICFHSYASRIGSKWTPIGWCVTGRYMWFPFIRFTNWKQERGVNGWDTFRASFHSYASRIGSKTSFAKLGCTRIVQRFFVGYWKA